MKKILVTGADGQLGMSIKKVATQYTEFEFLFTTKEQLDITSKQNIDAIFKDTKIDYCINCAGYTNVEQAEVTPEPAFLVNAEGVKNLAEICKKYQSVLTHVSTDYVFDGEKETPYTVYDKPNPINQYGKSKLEGEQFIQGLLSNYYIVRTSWLYSKEYGKNFYRSILAKAKKGEALYITDEQEGCPTNTENLADFILKLIVSKATFGMYHFCDMEAMTWFEFANKILQEHELKQTTELTKKEYISSVKRPKYSVLKNNLIEPNP